MVNDVSETAFTVTRSISLDAIARKADWIRMDAEDLVRYVNLIVSLPRSDMTMEWTLSAAYAAMEKAMESMKEAHAKMIIKRQRAEMASDRDDEDIRYHTETAGA